MTDKLSLSEEEIDLLKPVLSAMSNRRKGVVTLEYLLSRWANFVSAVENIYEFSIYDYTNDLAVRDLLEEVLCICPERLRQKLLVKIKGIDDRFVTATSPVTHPLLRGESRDWWWYRVPKEPSAELADDLTSAGFILGGKIS